MFVHVIGGNKQKRELVAQAAEFFLKKLITDGRQRRPILLDIELVRNLRKNDNVEADVVFEDTKASHNSEFFVRVDAGMPLRDTLIAVAHELVHVKQYRLGELVQHPQKSMWKGQAVTVDDYYDRPWEIEAFGRQLGLFVRFAEQCGYADCAWAHDPY